MSNEQQDIFKNIAQETTLEKKAEEERRSQPFEYTPLLWTAFTGSGDSKIIRIVSDFYVNKPSDRDKCTLEGKPIFDNTSATIINLVEAYSDAGKKFFMYVPSEEDDPAHFYWRLYNLVLDGTYVDDPHAPPKKDGTPSQKKIHTHQKNHPDIVDRVFKNGINTGLAKGKFSNGMKAKRTFIANVIDREQMDRHREEKHTFLLSKNVREWEGKTFYDTGLPSYGFSEELDKLVQMYSSLKGYDLYVQRTGVKTNPYEVKNASKFVQVAPEEIPKDFHSFVSTEPLTDEELSWERYDLVDTFKHSSYSKWFKNMKVFLKQVDSVFNTRFHDEVESKAKEEDAKRKKEAEKAKKEESTTVQGTDLPATEETKADEVTPKRRPRKEAVANNSLPLEWATFEKHGFTGEEYLTEELIAMMDSIEIVNNQLTILWKQGTELYDCDNADCNCKLPEEATGCIKCSTVY